MRLQSLFAFADILAMLGDPDWQTAREDIELLKADKKRRTVVAADKRQLTEAVFWELIETAKDQAASLPERVVILRESLGRFSAANVKRFQALLLFRLNELNTSDIWALLTSCEAGVLTMPSTISDNGLLRRGKPRLSSPRGVSKSSLKPSKSLTIPSAKSCCRYAPLGL